MFSMFFPKYRKTIIILSHFLCFLYAKPAKASLSSLQVTISMEQIFDDAGSYDIFSTEKVNKELVDFNLLLWWGCDFSSAFKNIIQKLTQKHGMVCGKRITCAITPPHKPTVSTVLNYWYKGGDSTEKIFLLDLHPLVYRYLLALNLNNLLDEKSYEMIKNINSQRISCYLKELNSNTPISFSKISNRLKKKIGKGESIDFSIDEVNFKRDGKLVSRFQGCAQEKPTPAKLNNSFYIDVELGKGDTASGLLSHKIMYGIAFCVRALACFI